MCSRQTITDELVDIYTLFRLLDFCDAQRDIKKSDQHKFKLQSLFPKGFFSKVLDEHISLVIEKSNLVCNQLFELAQEEQGTDDASFKSRSKVEEFFHFSLHRLYDFVLKLDWYDDSSFVAKEVEESRYSRFKDFLKFRDHLDGLNVEVKAKQLVVSPDRGASSPTGSGIRLLKSSLRSGLSSIANSPKGRRRVSFKNEASSKSAVDNRANLNVRMWFALDLQIYAVNVLIQQLCASLWTSVTDEETKNSPRHRKSRNIIREVQGTSRLFITTLESIQILCKDCLLKLMSDIISYESSKGSADKLSRIQSYLVWISKDVESKIVSKFARYFATHYKPSE